MKTAPLVTLSNPARRCMRVDFPEPEGPMIAVYWPRGNRAVTPSRAVTAVPPAPYTLTRSTARAASLVAARVCGAAGRTRGTTSVSPLAVAGQEQEPAGQRRMALRRALDRTARQRGVGRRVPLLVTATVEQGHEEER